MTTQSRLIQLFTLVAALYMGFDMGKIYAAREAAKNVPATVASDPHLGQVLHRNDGPTIEQVRQLSSLVVTKVDVADVTTTEIAGFTGGVRAALVVRGDLVIAVDLAKARFESQDLEKRTAVLVLPAPEVSRPRLDQEKSRVFELTRQGLWAVVPGDTSQSAVVNHAYRHAQQVVAAAGADPKLIERSRQNAEETTAAFFNALGWTVTIRWSD